MFLLKGFEKITQCGFRKHGNAFARKNRDTDRHIVIMRTQEIKGLLVLF